MRLIQVYPITYKNQINCKTEKTETHLRRIQKLCQTTKTELSAKTVNAFQQLTVFANKLHPRCFTRP